MNHTAFISHVLLFLGALTPFGLRAQVQIAHLSRGAETVALKWQDGFGPYIVETSHDLLNWSNQGEPAADTTRNLPAFADRSFHRVADLNPSNLYGGFFGLVQTEQGEFGALMARHRLKTRLWLYKTKGDPHASASFTPANYWRKLLINYQYHEDDRVRTRAGPLENLGTVAIPTSQRLTVTWTSGGGSTLRTYVLTMNFPYDINANRSTAPFPSDPTYALECRRATPQPELDFAALSLTNTALDTVKLIQMDPSNYPTSPDQSWPVRNFLVSKNGVQVNLHFLEGLPLYQGRPPGIFKTLLLDRWLSPTTASGRSLPAFSTDSYFSRTLLPGHHNFYEYVLIEPALDPALSEKTRSALNAANIRHIFTFKSLDIVVGGNSDDIRYFGYDNTVRSP